MVVEWEEMVVEWGIMGVMNGMAAVRLKMCMVVGTLRWTGCMCLLEKDGIYPVFVTAPVFMRKWMVWEAWGSQVWEDWVWEDLEWEAWKDLVWVAWEDLVWEDLEWE